MSLKSVLRKFLSTFILVIICQSAYSQTITIGTNTITTTNFPTSTSKKYNYTQQIYTSTEVGTSASICGVSFYRTSTGNVSRTLQIYIGHTNKNSFTSNTSWEPASSLTLVFSGSVGLLSNQWTYINFDTPFLYNGSQNIVIAVDDNSNLIESTTGSTFRYTTSTNKALCYSNNNINPVFTSPPSGTRSTNRNNILIHKCQPTPMANTTITTCNHFFADPGGMNNYAGNLNVTQTFVSESGNSDPLFIHFLQFSLGNGDTLWIYNGGNITAPLVGYYTGNNIPFDFAASGDSLTIRFKSNGENHSTGWLASIYCKPCDPISILPGSPCQPSSQSSTGYAAKPFCTDENPYGITFPSATSGDADVYLPSRVGCLLSVPRPAWYFMQINTPGNMLINIAQTSANGRTMDVDFACWGPFYAQNQTDFMQRWCCGEYNLYTASGSNHVPTNGHHSSTEMGGYPINNLIDCSWALASTEWCYIPNAQTQQFYILLISNWDGGIGTITFNTVPQYTTATTDCSLLALVSSNGPLCEGGTIQLTCNNPQPNATYSWTGPNGFTSTLQNPTIPNVTTSNNGTYSLVVTVNTVSSPSASTTITINSSPTVVINAPTYVCYGDSLTLTASGATTYSWNNSLGSGSTKRIRPLTTTTYMVTGTQSGCTDTSMVTINIRPNPTTAITVPSIFSCPNIGSINVHTTTSGGEPNYNYTWSGSGVNSSSTFETCVQIDSSICNQIYNVRVHVTDTNGCRTSDTATFVIKDTTDPVFNTLPFPIQYAEGTYPNYTVPDFTDIVRANSYDNCWGSSQLIITQNLLVGSNINANTYVIVTVTDPCENSASTYIRLIIPLDVSFSDTIHVSCNGENNGSASVEATGGIGPYTYSWSTDPIQHLIQAGSLAAGNYQVTVTDSLNVSSIATVTIVQPAIITLTTSNINPHCFELQQELLQQVHLEELNHTDIYGTMELH